MKCSDRISCDDCAKDLRCDAEDCLDGPYCSDCADEELVWFSCCEKYFCNSCSVNACDCGVTSDYSVSDYSDVYEVSGHR